MAARQPESTQPPRGASHGDADNGRALRVWLQRRGIELLEARGTNRDRAALDPLVKATAESISAVGPLLERLRSSIAAGGRPINLSLARAAPTEVEQITSWCELLRDCGLLIHYRYDRWTHQLWARPELGAREILGGAWLERFVSMRLSEQLRELDEDPLVLSNVRIRLANRREGELDVVGWVCGAPVWIECRSGRFTDRLGAYAARRRDLELDSERALLVVVRAAPQQIRLVRALHGIRIVPLADLEPVILGIIQSGADHPGSGPSRWAMADEAAAGHRPKATGPSQPSRPARSDGPAAVFRRVTAESDQRLLQALAAAGLQPHPEHRRQCLEALASHMAIGIPTSGPRLVEVINAEARLPEVAVRDVLAALARGGALLDEKGEPIRALDATIHALAARSADDLDKRCRHVYRATLRANDPTAACGPDGERAFDATVG